MTSQALDLHNKIQALALTLLLSQTLALNTDGVLLLTFKYSILSDPLGVLDDWNIRDQNPCSWQGVTCGEFPTVMANSSNQVNSTSSPLRVTTVSLPSSQLLGSISADLGMIPHLRDIDLSNNSINGSIPLSLLRASELQTLDLSNNLISGELSELAGGLKSLKYLNLSDNALSGKIPRNLTTLSNLTVISLKSNYFSGDLPSSFEYVRVLDISSNLINGSLPMNFSGNNLHYFNMSYNRISGEIPPEFANEIPTDAVIDFSFNNFTGPIPETNLFSNQDEKSYDGNSKLCGKPLKNLCPIPSTMSSPPNVTTSDSPPAIAAFPNPINSSAASNSSESPHSGKNGLRPTTIVAIIVGDGVGVLIVAVIFFYVYKLKKNRSVVPSNTKRAVSETYETREFDWSASSEEEPRGTRAWGCLRKQASNDEESSESTTSEEPEIEDHEKALQAQKENKKNGALVTVDGDKELEIETLLKASAYILGATGSSIMYKAVLEDGTTMAVRRIGENGVERFKDFENQVRAIAKLVHPNLVRIRGFYWGADEKLVIYDFVPNGSLSNARYRKAGSSPCHLPWEVRIKIARGIARGLTYIHDKKHVHGNLKPSNILLGSDMEPKIGDFGLERLVTGESGYKPGASARNFGSKRSTASRDSFQDNQVGSTPSPSPSSLGGISPYYAPESLRSLKPNAKWDVFSFGVIILELLTGKVIVSDELGPGASGLVGEEKNRILRMADVAIRADLEGREDALLALLKLGFNCLSPNPQRRPNMKEILQVLEKFPSSSSTSSFY